MVRNHRDDTSPRHREQDTGNHPLEGGQAIAEAIRQIIEVVRNQMGQSQHVQQDPQRGDTWGCPFERFLIYRYPNFMGTEGALRANKWLLDLERTFNISGCTEDQKVQYVGHLLQGEASIWWDTKQQLLAQELGDVATLTWEWLKKDFDSCFFLETAKQQQALEFANLVQGNMMVEQYATLWN
ncbi:uncharacterized protein LOC122274203 [Carya illinoinensis]|uniref:uncharacterized protein LOC122274203 n=1 Tax=Carya illinoinensis TaxID=32201 RepID=UPI001C71E461|nr:uncharacterized protein LOC122274203 [Carya illinoinensis]